MKNRALSLLVASLVFFSACKDKTDPIQKDNFTLTFRALYDGQPLEKYKNFPYGDKTIYFDRFNTFLSDITLVGGSVDVRLSDIAWVDFMPDSASSNKAVDITFKFTVPDGDYTGLKLGYGVSAALNAKKPSDFPVEHPLYLESEYWQGWQSYIFTKVQGRYDLDGDNTPEANLFYHCGSDAVYHTAILPKNISVSGDAALLVEFDLKKLFTFDGQLLDLSDSANRTTSHDASNIALGQKVISNFKNATILQ
ncbi:MAG: hypothetical protein KA165_05415 [Saprospiraceae bacterium]|nr:hypothetical protein [Saprospiraceae bacterium]